MNPERRPMTRSDRVAMLEDASGRLRFRQGLSLGCWSHALTQPWFSAYSVPRNSGSSRYQRQTAGKRVNSWASRRSQSLTDAFFQFSIDEGGPQCLPPAFACAKPAFTRSRIMTVRTRRTLPSLKHGLAGGCRDVDALMMQEQVNAQAVQLG
jgi:hypothetical protein